MIQKKYGKSLTIATATLSLLFLSHVNVQAADPPKPKPLPGVQLLLLSDNPPQPPPVPPPPVPQPNIAFVTSRTYVGGSFGDLAAADKACQSLAEAARLPLNTYKAWLSTPSVSAIKRLGSARGWIRTDGKAFANERKEIIERMAIFHPLVIDEMGKHMGNLGGGPVWTGTNADGTVRSDGTCSDWTSTAASGLTGNYVGVSDVFTESEVSSCTTAGHLYCFGINNDVPVTVNPVVGRIAFVTNGSWTPAGLAEADALCQKEADAASLKGKFKALLAAVDQSAAQRFSPSSLPWVRPDGVALAPTAAAFFSAKPLDTAINVTADGQYLRNVGVWGGALTPADVEGTVAKTCNNWTSPDIESTGLSGWAAFTYPQDYFGKVLATCDDKSKRLYCLQDTPE